MTEHLQIPRALCEDLLSALRRHDPADSARLLDRWASAEHDCADDPDEWVWDGDDEPPLRYLDHELSAWVHREATLHVAGGRFEYALCLVEQYRPPFKPDASQEPE